MLNKTTDPAAPLSSCQDGKDVSSVGAPEAGNGRGAVFIRDIRFDGETGYLTFRGIEDDARQPPESLSVHPDDGAQITRIADRSCVSVELRSVADFSTFFLLILHDCTGGMAWSAGAIAPIATRQTELIEAIATKSRLEELGRQASVLGHELRQPLFTIAMANENLRLLLAAPEVAKAGMQRAVDKIEQQVERAQTIIARTLGYVTGTDATQEISDMEEALRNAADFLDPLLDGADVRMTVHPAQEPPYVGLSRIEQEQIFVNILRNAVDSIAARRRRGWTGEGKIEATFQVDPAHVRCVVCDNGIGLAAGTPGRNFQPFFTTKAEEGTGLGLYACEQIVVRAGGTIDLLPGEVEGARFEIVLPACRDEAASDIVAG